MNKIYKLVWNKITKQLVVVSELARGAKKATGSVQSPKSQSKLLIKFGITPPLPHTAIL